MDDTQKMRDMANILSVIMQNAKMMGMGNVTAIRDIPLEDVELVIMALEKFEEENNAAGNEHNGRP